MPKSITEKLYYRKPYLQTVEAEIAQVVRLQEYQPPRMGLVLDRSVFYPEGGGQPGDSGYFGDLQIMDTQKAANLVKTDHQLHPDAIVHICPLNREVSPGHKARLQLDWNHRLDFMQQHTGQHIISAAFYHIGRYSTVSVHQGTEYTTIEFRARDIPDADILAAGELANLAIMADLTVSARFAGDGELENIHLRRSPETQENFRIVEIGGSASSRMDLPRPFDLTGCGGVHLERCGEVQLIRHLRTERIRGRVRLYWKTGDRALRDYANKHWIVDEAVTLLSRPPEQISRRIRQMQDEITRLRKKLREQERQRIYEQLETAISAHTRGVLSIHFENADMSLLRDAARKLQKTGKIVAVLSAWTQEEPDKLYWIALNQQTRARDFSSDAADILKHYDARGGGNPPLWQGSMALNDAQEDNNAKHQPNEKRESNEKGQPHAKRESNAKNRAHAKKARAQNLSKRFRDDVAPLLNSR